MAEAALETEAMRVLLRGMEHLDIETYSMPADSAGDVVNLPLLGIVGLLLGEHPDPGVCEAARADFTTFLRRYEAACCRLVLGAIWEDISTLALPSTVDWSTSGVTTRTYVHTSQRLLCDNISAVWADAMCELQELVRLQPAPFVGGMEFKVVQLDLSKHTDPVQACFNWLQEMLTYAMSVIDKPREGTASNDGLQPLPAAQAAKGGTGATPPVSQQQQHMMMMMVPQPGLLPTPGALAAAHPGTLQGWPAPYPAFAAGAGVGPGPLGAGVSFPLAGAGGVTGSGGSGGVLPPTPGASWPHPFQGLQQQQQQRLPDAQPQSSLSPRSQAARRVGPLGSMPGRSGRSPVVPAHQPPVAGELLYHQAPPPLPPPPPPYGHAAYPYNWQYGLPPQQQHLADPSLVPPAPLPPGIGGYGPPAASGMQALLGVANRSFPSRGQYPALGSLQGSAAGGRGRGSRGRQSSQRGRG